MKLYVGQDGWVKLIQTVVQDSVLFVLLTLTYCNVLNLCHICYNLNNFIHIKNKILIRQRYQKKTKKTSDVDRDSYSVAMQLSH